MITPLLTPRFHGNGFIQVYLTPLTRLHIWSPGFPATRVQNARIHDHRFWFDSTILMGAIVHTEYMVSTEYRSEGKLNAPHGERGGISQFPHGLYQTSDHSKPAPLEKVNTCRVELLGEYTYPAGETYRFGGPDKFHDTNPLDRSELTATIMTKIRVHETYQARMVAVSDVEPDHAFAVQPDEQLLREEVRRVFKLLV